MSDDERLVVHASALPSLGRRGGPPAMMLPGDSLDPVSIIAFVAMTLTAIPMLGVAFGPIGLVLGGVGWRRTRRRGGRRLAVAAFTGSAALVCMNFLITAALFFFVRDFN